MQLAQRNLTNLADKLFSAQLQFRKCLENKDLQEEKYNEWVQNVAQIEQKAQQLGIDIDSVKKYKHNLDSEAVAEEANRKELLKKQKKILEQSYLISKKRLLKDLEQKKKECEKLKRDKIEQKHEFLLREAQLDEKEKDLNELLGHSGLGQKGVDVKLLNVVQEMSESKENLNESTAEVENFENYQPDEKVDLATIHEAIQEETF